MKSLYGDIFIYWVIPVAAALLLLVPGFHIYGALSIDGQVIDAETKKPLEGVVVAVDWSIYMVLLSSNKVDDIELTETVTDAWGRYHLPWWGPRFTLRGDLEDIDPSLILIKPGYVPQQLTNRIPHVIWIPPLRRSEWNGKTVELRKIVTNPTLEEIVNWSGTADQITNRNIDRCGWTKVPRATAEFIRLGDELVRRGLHRFMPVVAEFDPKGCGVDPQTIFGGLNDQ